MCYAIAEGSDRPKNPGGAQRSVLWQNGATRSSSTSQVSVFRDPTDAGDGQAVDQHGNPLLYIRYQPGGPGEKSLILKELTQLPKTQTMSELATALRSWRRHFGRAREVGASIHYHAVSIVFVDSIRIQGPWLHGSMKPGSPSCCRRPLMEHVMERK